MSDRSILIYPANLATFVEKLIFERPKRPFCKPVAPKCDTLNLYVQHWTFFFHRQAMILLMIFLFLNYYYYFFYKKRPQIARYIVYWSVEKVLRLLKSWHPVDQLSLKQLTIKALTLTAIITSDRGHAIHSMNIKKMHNLPVFHLL